jgi:predicted nucleotidyltransferase component of viral defense system
VFNRASPYFKQVTLIIELLPLFGEQTCFALKGGTAINLFVRDLPRLSVDIDLTYLGREERRLALNNIAAALGHVADRIDTTLQGVSVSRLTDKQGNVLKLQFERQGVRVIAEVSPVLRGTVLAPQMMDVSRTVATELAYTQMRLLDQREIFAGKLCAALDRQHPRDLFDVKVLLADDGIDTSLMDVFVVYLISGNRPIAELLAPNFVPLEHIYTNHFAGMTREPISLRELEDARATLVRRIHEKLTDEHKQFLLSVKRGEPDWDLLPFDNVADLPAVKWKLHNLEKLNRGKRKESIERLTQVLERE